MTQPLGEKTITPNVSGSFSGPSTGIKGLLIGNESPYTVDVKLDGQGTGKTLYPETVDFFAAGPQFNGVVIFKTRALLLNPTSYTASFLSFEAVGRHESLDLGAYPMALTRQAVSSTASGKPLYTATVGFGNTASLKQILNIFNPANSGVTYTFHSARCFTNDATIPTVNLAFVPGADS